MQWIEKYSFILEYIVAEHTQVKHNYLKIVFKSVLPSYHVFFSVMHPDILSSMYRNTPSALFLSHTHA